MPATALPALDPRILAEVRRRIPLDQLPKEAFDRVTDLAAELLEAPIGIMVLVGGDDHYLLSHCGVEPSWPAERRSEGVSLCQHVVNTGMPVIAGDIRKEIRLKTDLLALRRGLVAFAGMPITCLDYPVGVLAVADFVRRDWTDDKLATLAQMAAVATRELRNMNVDLLITLD